MYLRPKKVLSEKEVSNGLRLVIYDGLAAEIMTTLTGGAFLVAMAVLLGASNFQIGLLAALPTFTNIFQLAAIWLVRHYNSRRGISVLSSILARIPLLLIGIIVLLYSSSISTVIFFLLFHYLGGSIAGISWNSWMKDLVPEKSLGAYFARRGSYTQTLNVILSLTLALLIDYIKQKHQGFELSTYGIMFIVGGVAGLIGANFLARTPEPESRPLKENIFKLMKRPLHNVNFRKLLVFNSIWVFALNLATPFFTVFLLKNLQLPLSYIIGLNIVSQLSSIFTIRIWGKYADRYSNKTIIAIGAPLYILCLIAWCFVGIYSNLYNNLLLLAGIFVVSGVANAGINLSLTNIGLKLAPREEAIVYLSAKNIISSMFSAVAPLIGGWLADYFSLRHLKVAAEWGSPKFAKVFRLVELHDYNFLFVLGALFAVIALEFLVQLKEEGEVEKDVVVRVMRSNLRNSLKDAFVIGNLIGWSGQLMGFIRKRRRRRRRKKKSSTGNYVAGQEPSPGTQYPGVS
jgi:MFS family permease